MLQPLQRSLFWTSICLQKRISSLWKTLLQSSAFHVQYLEEREIPFRMLLICEVWKLKLRILFWWIKIKVVLQEEFNLVQESVYFAVTVSVPKKNSVVMDWNVRYRSLSLCLFHTLSLLALVLLAFLFWMMKIFFHKRNVTIPTIKHVVEQRTNHNYAQCAPFQSSTWA
jgi:hypothetical protein